MAPPPKYDRHWLLRRGDQAFVGAATIVALVALAAYWLVQGGGRAGGLLEIDRAGPLRAEFKVDLNAADWPELSQLPDIGETLAKRIVAAREADGPFVDHDDLRRVPGIGPKTLEKMRRYLLPLADKEAVAGDGEAKPIEDGKKG